MPDKPVSASVEPPESLGTALIEPLITEVIRQAELRGETRERERCAKIIEDADPFDDHWEIGRRIRSGEN